MKNPDRNTVSRLTDLPNVGPATEGDLRLLGIDHPKKLIGKNAFRLYDQLSAVTRMRHDPCVIDVFLSVIHFMEGGDPLPWWDFTAERKEILAGHDASKS